MKSATRFLGLALLVLAFGAIIRPGQGNAQGVKITAGQAGVNPGAGLFTIAEKEKLYAKNGLDVSIVKTNTAAAVQAMLGGSMQIATGSGAAAFVTATIEGAPPFVLVGSCVNVFPYKIMVRADIKTVADLKGKTGHVGVNRNINYTNICYYRCKFCAFSKGKTHEALRGTPYDLALDEVVRRSQEAWDRGATEVCLQGGIHPDYTGATYLGICRAIKQALPDMHVHAFSPLEVTQGAATLGLSLHDFLAQLKEAGLGTLPGTAAEILDDEVRAIICPDKVNTRQWLDVVSTAHRLGLRTTSTIMYGHVERPVSWARHLLVLRDLQAETGGITEFVPLPFVHMEAPMYLRGQARKGPTLREAVLMHAVARLALHPLITNIQTSWVKMGPEGAALCLNSGANDLGGTLMNESISRAAGTQHGQEFPPEAMEDLIRSIGRVPVQRDTLYRVASQERRVVSFNAPELAPVVQTPPRKVMAAE